MKKIYFNELKVAVEDQNDVMTIVTQEKVSKLAFLSQNYVHIYIYTVHICSIGNPSLPPPQKNRIENN